MHGEMIRAKRLLAVDTVLIGLLVVLAATVWFVMGKVTMAADRIHQSDVPQLRHIAELEHGVTRAPLLIRHAMRARTPQELAATMADMGERKQALYARLRELDEGMPEEEGRQAHASFSRLMDEFWKQSEANMTLIQQGRTGEALAFFVDRTIPARHALLASLAAERKRQSEGLASRIDEVSTRSNMDRDIVIGAVMLVVGTVVALAMFLRTALASGNSDPSGRTARWASAPDQSPASKHKLHHE